MAEDAEPVVPVRVDSVRMDFFKSGWRPTIGWVFAVAVAWQFIVRPAIETCVILWTGVPMTIVLPGIDGMLWELGLGLLGLGSLRTIEKIKGVQ